MIEIHALQESSMIRSAADSNRVYTCNGIGNVIPGDTSFKMPEGVEIFLSATDAVAA